MTGEVLNEAQNKRAREKSRALIGRGKHVAIEVVRVAESGGKLRVWLRLLRKEDRSSLVLRTDSEPVRYRSKSGVCCDIEVLGLKMEKGEATLRVNGERVVLIPGQIAGVTESGSVTKMDLADWVLVRAWLGDAGSWKPFEIEAIAAVM